MKDFGVLIQNCEQLLNFSQRIDIKLLDNVVACLYNGHGDSVSFLCKCFNYLFHKILNKF